MRELNGLWAISLQSMFKPPPALWILLPRRIGRFMICNLKFDKGASIRAKPWFHRRYAWFLVVSRCGAHALSCYKLNLETVKTMRLLTISYYSDRWPRSRHRFARSLCAVVVLIIAWTLKPFKSIAHCRSFSWMVGLLQSLGYPLKSCLPRSRHA